jgi:hypothetical protein
LTWQSPGDPDAGDVVSYDVYLGTTPDNTPLVCEDLAVLSCMPGVLQFDTVYHWQVVAKDVYGGETAGLVWSFATFTEDGDEDSDELNNGEEIFWGSDPFDSDSDNDGYSDGEEVAWGSDPTDDESIPNIDCEGDFDFDMDVDASDLKVFTDAYGLPADDPAFDPNADFDGDDQVGELDLKIFLDDYGRIDCP